MLWVQKLKKNLFSLSILEDKGFSITIKKGNVLINLEEASLDTIVGIRVGEDEL